MIAFATYLIYLLLSVFVLMVFFAVYSRITPFDEVLLIRQGNLAAALTLGGALVGFSLTLASCILHTSGYLPFLSWAAGALFLQLLTYVVSTRMLAMTQDHIESNNVAFGALMAAISLSVGAINAACIS